MSNRPPQRPPSPHRPGPPAPGPGQGPPAPGPHRSGPPAPGLRRGPALIAGLVLALALSGAILALLPRGQGTDAPLAGGAPAAPGPPLAGGSPATPGPAATPLPADGCQPPPPFTQDPALDLGAALALATDRQEQGLVMIRAAGPPYQHPTWDDAGYLGAIVTDGAGNIYAAPTPRQSLGDNPLAGATTLWRVDGQTGAMAPFVTLAGAASERNPYGIMGLAYACEPDAIYAGTVIGSTPSQERGGVTVIGGDGQIRGAALTGVDVMGVVAVRTGAGHELYAGLARSPEVVAVPLDARGLAAGPPRPLLDLAEAGATPSERARKLRLVRGELIVDLVPFNYSLQNSASGTPQTRRATYVYDPATAAWVASSPAR